MDFNSKISDIFGRRILKSPLRLVRFFVAYFMIPLHYLTKVLPDAIRSDHIWIFTGNRTGKEFTGNSKYMYLYLSNNEGGERPIWITKNKALKKELNSNGYEAYMSYELYSIYYTLRSSWIVTSNTFPILTFGFGGGASSIQLWHGVPLKNLKSKFRGFNPWELKDTLIKYDYLVTNTKREADAFVGFMNFRTLIISNYPRNDIFYRDIDGASIGVPEKIQNQLKTLSVDRTIIGYFPTWRANKSKSPPIDFDELDRVLDKLNSHMIVKGHRNQDFDKSNDNLKNIDFLSNLGDTYPLFKYIDVMVTDYSSIYFDYLHKDKPVIFFTYDFMTYLSQRGFFYEFESVTPGPKCFNSECLISEIKKVKESDDYRDERSTVKNIVFKYQDGDGSKRIVDYVKNS